MRQILTVFSFTLKDAARKKAFIISTALMLVVVTVLCAMPRIIDLFSSDTPEATKATDVSYSKTCYYIDDDNLIPSGMENLQANFLDTAFEKGSFDKADDYKNKIKDNSSLNMIVITADEQGKPFITITTKDFMSGLDASSITGVLSKSYVADVLVNHGVEREVINFAMQDLSYKSEIAGTLDLSGYAIGILATLLIFFAIYYYGYGVSMSVATEKTTRVMETLVVSAKPSRILIGKCLAMGVLGLLQFGGIILYGSACYSLLIPKDFALFGMPLSLSAFTPTSAALIIVYFILGYTLFAMMNAVCGASVSKIEDLNSAMMPVMLIALGSFYLGYFAAITSGGEGAMLKLATYIPFSAPFTMPFQLLNGIVSTTDVIISIVLMLVAIAIVTMISIKIYSASVLHYGKKLKLKDLAKSKM